MKAQSMPWLSKGVKYMILATLIYSVMGLVVKVAGKTLPILEIIFARCIFGFVFSYIGLRRLRISIWGNNRKFLILRGLFGFCALNCFFYALTALPLADVTVIQYSNPVFTALLAIFFLGERGGWREYGLVITALIGVVLVAKPTFLFDIQSQANPAAAGIALLGAILSAFAYLTVRYLSRTEHPLVTVFYFPVVATPLTLPLVWPVAVWPTPIEWLYLFAIGGLSQAGQLLMTMGLGLEKAGKATAIGYLGVVFAAIWGGLFFDQWPDLFSILGIIIIVGSALLMNARRQSLATANT